MYKVVDYVLAFVFSPTLDAFSSLLHTVPVPVACFTWLPLPHGIQLGLPIRGTSGKLEGGGDKMQFKLFLFCSLFVSSWCVWEGLCPPGDYGSHWVPSSRVLAGFLQSSNSHWAPITLFSFHPFGRGSDNGLLPLLVSGCLTLSYLFS